MSLLDRHAAVILNSDSETNQYSNTATAKPIDADQADEPNQSNQRGLQVQAPGQKASLIETTTAFLDTASGGFTQFQKLPSTPIRPDFL